MFNKKGVYIVKFLRKFGPHYAIERFGIMFLSLAISMILLVSSIVVTKIKYDNRALSGMAQYTSSFTMSLSGTTGSVQGVYTNANRTKSFLLLRFSDMSNIPVTADKYQLFLSGCDRDRNYKEIKCSPNAMIYMFGSTGYMGIYLYSSEPFPSQILNLYLRSVVNFTGSKSDIQYDDATFNQYDQARIYFNPGGTYAMQAAFLDEDDWDIFDIYEELVSRPAEKSMRTLLYDDLKQMRNQQLLINEYSQRIVDDGLVEPTTPSAIAGDRIYAKVMEPGITDDELKWSIKQNFWYTMDDDGSNVQSFDENEVRMYLDTKMIEKNGYHFNWQDGQIKNGYLKDLTQSDKLSDWKKYIDSHTNAESESIFNLDEMEWKYQDGTIFIPDDSIDDSGSVSKQQTISNDVNKLKEALQAFYDAKVKYQTVDLKSLLELEYNARDIETNYSINANESGKLLTLW